MEDTNNEEKLVGVRLGTRHREMFDEILKVRRRTQKAQMEAWIELEHELIKREHLAKGVA